MVWSDPPVIIGSAFRLPGELDNFADLWEAFNDPEYVSFTSAPVSRCIGFESQGTPLEIERAKLRGGWLGSKGIEQFDPAFFNISPGEAETLRPNSRLALELTWEALEKAGISPSSLRGKNVSTFVAMGTEDSWDLLRFVQDGKAAFDHRWAANSEPGGVSGRIAHFFDFRGPTATISSACSSAASALREGVLSLLHEDCDVSIVGAISTQFSTAGVEWARKMGLLSQKGHCSAFSSQADGYIASEGAVFLVLTRKEYAQQHNYSMQCEILSVSNAHNGATQTLTLPSLSAQIQLANRAVREAGIDAKDINFVEAHATGTRIGDAIELEGILAVHASSRDAENPLYLSSSKTVLGHCLAAACFVGILKTLCCFEHHALPPHQLDFKDLFSSGIIRIPSQLTNLPQETRLVAQINSFGFTGSVATIIIREPECRRTEIDVKNAKPNHDQDCFFFPFSAKTDDALAAHINQIYNWAKKSDVNLCDAAAILSLHRDHHSKRRLIPITSWEDLLPFATSHSAPVPDALLKCGSLRLVELGQQALEQFIGLKQNDTSVWSDEVQRSLNDLLSQQNFAEAACLVYECGYYLDFRIIYSSAAHAALLKSMPTYPFRREIYWRMASDFFVDAMRTTSRQPISLERAGAMLPATERSVAGVVARVLHGLASNIDPAASIFDIGIDSLNSIELAEALTNTFRRRISSQELYQLLTVKSICQWINEESGSFKSSAQLNQEGFDDLVCTYGKIVLSLYTPKAGLQAFSHNILLTGANGMLGSHVLSVLLKQPSLRVYCIVRGNAWAKIESSFKTWGFDSKLLRDARNSSRIVVISTAGLDGQFLGCNECDYVALLDSIDEVVHLAWKTNFNTPVAGFLSLLEGTRKLAEFSVHCRKLVRLHFVSSISTVVGYDGGKLVPEESLRGDASYCFTQGYAYSKSIAEHSLYRIQETYPETFQLCIVRVGQICGHSKTGLWSQDEMLPKIILSIPTLQAVPSFLPDVSWIPSDVCANVLCDIILSVHSANLTHRVVYNIANPTTIPWSMAVRFIGKVLGIAGLHMVPLEDYIALIQSRSNINLAIIPLLPFFQSIADSTEKPSDLSRSLDVTKTSSLSKSLTSCPKIDQEFMQVIIQSLFRGTYISINSTVTSCPSPVVLVFGTWTSTQSHLEECHNPIGSKIQSIASHIRQECRIENSSAEVALELQLRALETQLKAIDDLARRNITPCAVVGYSFGEFAAAVAAKILSEEEVVSIIVRRAARLQNVKGSMLSVFADIRAIRRVLCTMQLAPDIGIYAGPNHAILSGSSAEIAAAEDAFRNNGINVTMVKTTIPFHSHEVAHSLELHSLHPYDSQTAYVSGVTGSLLPGKRLGALYWQRHMQDSAQFYGCMQYVREHFPGVPVIDMGPGLSLTNIISRYEWNDVKCTSVQTCLSGRLDSQRSISAYTVPDFGLISDFSIATNSREASSINRSGVPVSTHSIAADNQLNETYFHTAAAILSTEFGYKEADDMLEYRFHDIGIQSLDFIHFTELMSKATGLNIEVSSFSSERTIREIIFSLL